MHKKHRRIGRYALPAAVTAWFLFLSFLLRIILFVWQSNDVSCNIFDIAKTFLIGLFFDIGTISYLLLPSMLYFLLLPQKLTGSRFDHICTWFFTSLGIFILSFSFLAELTFWDEFRTRFNFIAVDYLIYTNEVIANIRESYPLPLLIGIVVALTALTLLAFHRAGIFYKTFCVTTKLGYRAALLLGNISLAAMYTAFVYNFDAEWSVNRYNSEISKAGIYSFFAAFRNNQMKYPEFYTTIDPKRAIGMVRNKLSEPNSLYNSGGFPIHRRISSADAEIKKNVVLIMVESLSGSYMKEFGNVKTITPFLDSLAQHSIFFENLYATGTRTVRGMEAVTLSIPPTPGQSIVKRPKNHNLYTISNVFRSKGYECSFIYGGDGYFDNMNSYFGGNGFDIYDRGHGSVLGDDIKTARHNIDDSEVTFENAWGVCDEDIFRKMMKVSDQKFAQHLPFFNFVMTISNHRPYTYPAGKVLIPSGMSREGAVQYTDYSLRELLKDASKKPWFSNTVFIIIADHCASSAGRDEIDVRNYQIPAFIVNFPEIPNQKIPVQCSQIDLFPTLFGMMHWNYDSDFFGKDVMLSDFEQRAFIATYRKLGMIKGKNVMILSDQKKQHAYDWDKETNALTPIPSNGDFLKETISWYQVADDLFTKQRLK